MLFDTSSSNLATSRTQKNNLAEISQRLRIAGDKLATGQKAHGELVRAKSLEGLQLIGNSLNLNKVFEQTNSMLDAGLGAVQANLEIIRSSANDVSLAVLSELNESSGVSYAAKTAMGTLKTIVASLNGTHNGQTLFSGAALDSPALSSADAIVADVQALLEGAPDIATGLASVDFYFQDPSGGFETSVYLGTNGIKQNWEIARGNTLSLEMQANHSAIKETLRNVSVLAAVSTSSALSRSDQNFALKTASEQNLNANDAMIELQSEVGFKQQLVAQASTRIKAESFSLSSLRSDKISVDLFEQASVFEELQSTLEASYQVVSRLSNLRLSNYL